MAITNLTGTKWVINNNFSSLNMDTFDTYGGFSINFIANGSEYKIINFGYTFGEDRSRLYYGQAFNNSMLVYDESWINQNYRTIEFTGGEDVANTVLISFLQTNAEQQIIENKKNMYVGGNKVSKVMVGDKAAKKILIGDNVIYEVEPPEPPTNVVRFVSASARTITPKYTNTGITLQYSVDNGATWTTIASGASTTSATEHWFRGQATGTKRLFTSSNATNVWAFSGSSDLEVYGNLNFLLCDALGDEEAPTSLGTYAYAYMFRGCTSLTTAPELPATTLANYCYATMFYNCTSLTTAPNLPATTLATECYNQMFSYCTSLTTPPELPATTLANYCYASMFSNCTSLVTAPELPTTTLVSNCYQDMFYNCTSFKVSATNTGSYTYAWRIPTSGTGTTATNWSYDMLSRTGGSFTSNPTINTTYYVQNQPV